MKRIVFFFLLVVVFQNSIHAQKRFRAGIKAGLSTSQVHGDTYGGFHKFGVDAGILVVGKLQEKWTAQMEMIFIQKGSRHYGNPDAGDYSFYQMDLNYIEVPLLFQYHHKKFTFEAGPGFGYLISAKEYDTYGEIHNAKPFKTTEITLGGGMSWELFRNLSINWRYSNSIVPIRTFRAANSKWDNEGQRNNVLAFTLIYMFGKNGEK